MLLELTRRGKICYVQFSAILFMREKFFFKGSIIGVIGGLKIRVDQDPKTILASVAHASAEAQKKAGK